VLQLSDDALEVSGSFFGEEVASAAFDVIELEERRQALLPLISDSRRINLDQDDGNRSQLDAIPRLVGLCRARRGRR
jgi:hypothetical protein